jgi:hypothetical protein
VLKLLFIPIFLFMSLYLLLFVFLAIMSLYRAERAGVLAPETRALCTPMLWFGYLLDFLCNAVPASVVFMDLPREWLVTARLQRYADGPPTWRRALALWVARKLLDPFDPKGYHVYVKPVGEA